MSRRKKKKGAKQKPMSLTLRHLLEGIPESDHFVKIPSRRLDISPMTDVGSYIPWPQIPFSAEAIANDLNDFGPNASVFADSNIFLAETPGCIWEAMFRNRQLTLVGPVVNEIENWLHDPRGINVDAHRVVAAARHVEDDRVTVFDLPIEPEYCRWSYEYYANLLGLRKDLVPQMRMELQRLQSSIPSKQDVNNAIKQAVNERALRLALSGEQTKVESHRYNDEGLVVLAIMFSIATGCESIILTRDQNVFEQFYKACWLLDTHYRSMLYAQRYARNPLEFLPVERVKQSSDRRMQASRAAFSDDETLLLWKPSGSLRELLPSKLTRVKSHCCLIHERRTNILTFTLACEMKDVFRVKWESEGRNTDLLDGRNCHIYLGPLTHVLGNQAAIGSDLTVACGKFRFSLIDVNLAVSTQESFSRTRGTSIELP